MLNKERNILAALLIGALSSAFAFAGPTDLTVTNEKSAVSPDGPETPDFATEMRPPFSSRDLTQFPGISNGCQTWGATGYVAGPSYRRADNFKPLANSTIHSVRWSGYYRQIASQAIGAAPGGESFDIRILIDNAGIPGAVLAGPLTVQPTSTPDGTFGTGGPTIYDYEATLPAGVDVTADTCYWIEIINTNTAGQRWYWISAAPGAGDAYHYYTGATSYVIGDQVAADLAFCLDIELQNLGTNPCPKPAVPAACTSPDTNGQPRNGATSGFSSNVFGSTTVTGGSSIAFERAEAFRLDSAGDITQVCFYAFWNPFGAAGGGNVGDGYPANPDIKVTYFANDPLTGFPGAELASFVVGQPGVSIIRDTAPIHVITHPAFHVSANTCYHIGISYLSDVNDPSHHARFIWGFSNTTDANADGVCSTRNTTTNPPGAWTSTAFTAPARGLSFLFNIGNAILPSCAPPPATNISCATAAPLTINGNAVLGNNIGVAPTVIAPCQFSLIYGGIVWYSVVGDGTTVTLSTCNSTLFGDTNLSVWCAPNGCANELNCLQGNDDAGNDCGFGALASITSFPTVANQTYYISVNGAGGTSTAFAIAATSDGIPANPPAAACGTFQRCELSAASADITDPEPCLDSTNAAANTNNVCAGATIYPAFGTVAAGQASTFVNGATLTRDFDLWLLPTVNEPTAVTWNINAEFPVFYTFLNYPVDCTSTATTLVSAVRLACQDAFLGQVTLPNTGINVVRITLPDFQGLPCPNYNDYRLTINTLPVGRCCAPATQCQLISQADCDAQTGVWLEGGVCEPTDPCNGVCCTGASCVASAATDCTAAGSSYIPGAAGCSPASPCTPTGVCCRGATCNTTIAQAACTIGTGTAGALFSTSGAVCNAGPVSHVPCCYANYNKVNGITVQDIFDFLSDWFAGNPYAKVGSDGVTAGLTVQNIFDFLSDWFTGGCS